MLTAQEIEILKAGLDSLNQRGQSLQASSGIIQLYKKLELMPTESEEESSKD